MNTVYLMVGAPGSGKSTWVQNRIAQNGHGIWISRDKIRFSLLEPHDDYFAKEGAVFAKFIYQVHRALKDNSDEDIYIDATHLNEQSRGRILDKILVPRESYKLIVVDVNTPVATCVRRAGARTGREFVSASVVRRMYAQKTSPNWDVFHKYDEVIEVNGGK